MKSLPCSLLKFLVVTLVVFDFGEAQWQYQWQWAMAKANSYRTSCDWKTGRFKCTKETCTHSIDGRKECTISEVPIGNSGNMPNSQIGGASNENWASNSNYRYQRPVIGGHSYRTQCRTLNGIRNCIHQRCISINGRQECSSSDGYSNPNPTPNNDQLHVENNGVNPNMARSDISHYDFPGRFN